MASTEDQLTELFERFSADLAALDPSSVDQVLCPLCARVFGRTAIKRLGPEGLSKEHIIPTALGGSDITLTCRRCNNTDGSARDAHLIRMIRANSWSTGDGSELRGHLSIGDERLPVKISRTDGSNPTVMRILGGKPEVLERQMRRFPTLQEGDEIDLSVDFNYIPTNAMQGLIRIAYLALFDSYGYRYVLSGAGQKLRKIIREGTDNEVGTFMLRCADLQAQGVRKPIIVAPVTNNSGILAYLVIMRFNTARESYHSVLMPTPEVTEDEVLSRLFEVGTGLNGSRFTMRPEKE